MDPGYTKWLKSCKHSVNKSPQKFGKQEAYKSCKMCECKQNFYKYVIKYFIALQCVKHEPCVAYGPTA